MRPIRCFYIACHFFFANIECGWNKIHDVRKEKSSVSALHLLPFSLKPGNSDQIFY